MNLRSLLRCAVLLACLAARPLLGAESLRIVIPAAAGSAIDVAARDLGAALAASGGAKNVQYDNRPGAGGTIGLAQFVSQSKGDPAVLFVAGDSVAQAVVANRSAITLTQLTPLARIEQPGEGRWLGAFAAQAITAAQRDEWVAALGKATASTQWRNAVASRGAQAAWLPADVFGGFVESEMRRLSAARGGT